jgi:hypothetical protein
MPSRRKRPPIAPRPESINGETMSVPVYDPQISVVLKKNIGRANVGGDIAASTRFQGTARTIDLTPWLGDAGGVKTSKSVRQPAGMFSIVLADRMEDSERDSLYAAIEPMDVVEIRMARDISKYTGAFTKHMPITMRGFVTSVRRSEIMTERGPRRAVIVTGQDYGKILQINQIVYMPFGPTGNRLLTNMNLFANYGVTIDPDQDASEFVTQIVEKVVNVFIANMAAGATSTGVALGITPLQVIGVDAIVHNDIVSPVGTNQWPGGTVYDLLRYFGDVGAWNELNVEDREDAPYLVYRPNPFKTSPVTGFRIPTNRRRPIGRRSTTSPMRMSYHWNRSGPMPVSRIGTGPITRAISSSARRRYRPRLPPVPRPARFTSATIRTARRTSTASGASRCRRTRVLVSTGRRPTNSTVKAFRRSTSSTRSASS